MLRPAALAILFLLVAAPASGSAAPLRAVVFDNGDACAIDARGRVSCTDAADLPPSGVVARDLTVSYWSVLVDDRGKVWRWTRGDAAMTGVPVPFAVSRVAYADQGEVCVLGEQGELACGVVYSADGVQPVDVGAVRFKGFFPGQRSLWLVDTKGDLWCRGGDTCPRMRFATRRGLGDDQRLDDPRWPGLYTKPMTDIADIGLGKVAAGVGRLFVAGGVCAEVTATPGVVACWDWAFGPRLVKLRGDEILQLGNYTCHRKGAHYTCTRPPGDAVVAGVSLPAVHTFTVRGAVRTYLLADRLCIDASGAVTCAVLELGRLPSSSFVPLVWASPPPKQP